MSGDTVASSVSFGQYDSFDDFPAPGGMVLGSLAWAKNSSGGNASGLYVVRQTAPNVYAWNSIESSGGGAAAEFVFADFGTQDPSQGRYTSWTDLMAAISNVQFGAAPRVIFALTSGPFTVPLAGMPITGWDFRGGSIASFYNVVGSVVLVCPAGVKLDNLFSMGGATMGSGSIILKIAPPAGDSVLSFSALPPGSPWTFLIGGGSYVDHSASAGALLKGDDSGRVCVIVANQSVQNTPLAPALSGPLLEIGNSDSAVGTQFGLGGLPNNWLVGGGPASGLISIHDAECNPNTNNNLVWIPGFTGGGPVTELSFTNSGFIAYTPAVIGDWSGVAPSSVADALDRIAAKITPIP